MVGHRRNRRIVTEAFQLAFPRRPRKKRRGRQLRPPRLGRLEDRYAARLIAFLDAITVTVDRELSPQLAGIVQEQAVDEILIAPIRLDDAADRIARIFRRISVFAEQEIPLPRINQQAQRTAVEVNSSNEDYNIENVRAVVGVSVFPAEPWLVTEMEHFTHENASLIQGVAEEQLRDIEQSVFRNVRAGASARNIQADILEIVDRNKGRARLIARDQINKFNGRLTQLRQKSLGITEYTWSTAQDERVRPTHQVLDGTVQEWANPPVTVRSGARAGERNHPGFDIQCRCVGEPIFPDEL